MTILDYLLLGGAIAVIIYVIYRLFLGWRYSCRCELPGNATEPGDATRRVHSGSSTAASWQRRQSTTATGPEI